MHIQFVFFLLFYIISSHNLFSQGLSNGRWRIHLPYKEANFLQITSEDLFVVAEKGFYKYHLIDGEVQLYSKIDGFSDMDVAFLRLIPEKNTIVILYKNGNLDLFDIKNETIINVPDILRKQTFGEILFNEVSVYGNLAYVSSSLGIIVVDLIKKEIKDSYNLSINGNNNPITSVAEYDGYLYASNATGILRGKLDGTNLSDYNNWNILKSATIESKLLRTFNNLLFFEIDSILYQYNGNAISDFYKHCKRKTQSLEISNQKLIETHYGGILIYNKTGNVDSIREGKIDCVVQDHEDRLWIGGSGTGLFNIDKNGNYNYTGIVGPNSYSSYQIKSLNNEIYVTGGGHGNNYGPVFNGAGYYIFRNNTWENRPPAPDRLKEMYDFTALCTNPANGDVWVGTHGTGLALLRNGQFISRFDETNSTLRKQLGIFNIIGGLDIDNDGNLWVSNYDVDSSLSVRYKNGQWKSFATGNKSVGKLVVDDFNQKWTNAPRNSNIGLFIFKEGPNGINQTRFLTKTKGQGGLPSNTITTLIKDKDGEIWIGTDAGLCVFYNPSRVFESDEDAQRIIIEENNEPGYLLGTEVINDIAIDGANRKWIATNNGAWLVAKDGSNVIQHFTVDNSPIFSNVVKSIGINGITGEVFFGTDKGLISYGGDATEATEKHSNIEIYPNPVRENFNGLITIKGLPSNASVKITDASGKIVFETIANGGTATWNGLSFSGKKLKTGVYLIFTANEKDEESQVSKLLIIN